MDSEKAYLRLLLNDINVDLGVLSTGTGENNNRTDDLASFVSVQLSDLKERVSNLDNANRKYQIDSVKDEIGEFVNKIRTDIIPTPNNKNEIKLLQENAIALMSKLS